MPCTPLYLAKEGRPFNTVTVDHARTSLWNATEDPTLPMDADSLSALVCSRHILQECKKCVSGYEFAMSSTQDLTIKKYTPDVFERSVYAYALDVTFYPVNEPGFPNTSIGSYSTTGYPTIWQGEANKHGSQEDKFATGINVELDAKAQTIPGRLYAQIGVSNSAHCLDFFNARPVTLDCLRGDAGDAEDDDSGLRPAKPASYSYYRVGSWISARLFVGDSAGNLAPKGSAVSLNRLVVAIKQKNESWENQ